MNIAFLIVPLLAAGMALLTRYVDNNRHKHPRRNQNVAAHNQKTVRKADLVDHEA